MAKSLRIAIDVHGGDHGSAVTLGGVLEAREKVPFHPVLCGVHDEIEAFFSSRGITGAQRKRLFTIMDAPQKIVPTDAPALVWKTHKRSSVVQALNLVAEGSARAVVSAGNSGVLMASALFLLGRLPGISRPAIAAPLPSVAGLPVLLLDAGANTDCRAEQLLSFGILGERYYRTFFAVKKPRVALLNVGREPGKGPRAVLEAASRFPERVKGYIGFIEGSRLLFGDADVVVCDGFTGNALLKTCESFYHLAAQKFAVNDQLRRSLRSSFAVFNADNYGAAPILGLKGVVYKAHGASSSHAFARAIESACTAVKHHVLQPGTFNV